MEELNRNEEQIMNILWELEKGLVRDIIDRMEEPKPPYTTVSSVVRLLEKKKYVGHKAYGKTYEYYPLVSKADYRKKTFGQYLSNFFDNSPQSVLSFMVKEKKIKKEELEDLKKLIEEYEKGESHE